MTDYGHQLQFGFFPSPDAAKAPQTIELARLADVSGLDLTADPKESVDALIEAIQVIRGVWGEGSVSVPGEHDHVKGESTRPVLDKPSDAAYTLELLHPLAQYGLN